MGQVKLDVDRLLQERTEHLEIIHEFKTDGWITLASKIDGKYKQRHHKYFALTKELQAVEELVNVYISQNTFYKPQRRIETIRQLRACYIDLDCYNTEYSKEAVLYFMEQDYYNKKIPKPNLVIDSGRGLYFIWIIEPVPHKALPLWKAVQDYLYNQIKEFGADRKAIDPTRVLRLVGSINSKTNTQVKILESYDYRYTLREIQSEYLPELNGIDKNNKKKKGRPKKYVSLYNLYHLHCSRVDDIVKLCKLRDYKLEGHREEVLFLYRYWTCCISEDENEALQCAIELNERFKPPLTLREVTRATKSAEKGYKEWLEDKKKGYNYKNSTLIEILEITEEEQKQLKTIIGTKEKYRRNNERRKAERRNEAGLTKREQAKQEKIQKVKKLHKKGLKQKEIAEEAGISQQLVSRYLKG